MVDKQFGMAQTLKAKKLLPVFILHLQVMPMEAKDAMQKFL